MIPGDQTFKAMFDSNCFRLGPVCLTNGLLELWSFDEAVINSLTKEDILKKINQPNIIR